jgi:hypothetical protein
MSLVLNVEILGEFKNLTAATKGAESQLAAMNKKAQTVSRSIAAAFAAVGLTISFRAIANELEEATKAAVADTKSQKTLALAMKNTGKATEGSVAQAEKNIKKMMLQAGIADDELRPAFQKLFIATGDVDEATRLLGIAMDTATGTGKGLDTVAQAMARSLAGSDGALARLVPSVKGSKTPIDDLGMAFKGAAGEAANLDPYQRMNVIFGEMQEQVGMALMPKLLEFSTWLATKEGQEKLQEIVDLIVDILTAFTDLVTWLDANKEWLAPTILAIGGLTLAWKAVEIAIGVAKTAQALFATQAVAKAAIAKAAWAGLSFGGVAAVGGTVAAIGAGAAAGGFMEGQQRGITSQIYAEGFKQMKKDFNAPKGGQTINVNVKTVNDAKTTIKSLSQFEKSTGLTLGQALRQ